MLNLVLLKDGESTWGDPKPCWELESPHNAERVKVEYPNNQAELLTLQSRRILLKCEDDRVIGYNAIGGDFFDKQNAFCEQMAGWYTVKNMKTIGRIIMRKIHLYGLIFPIYLVVSIRQAS